MAAITGLADLHGNAGRIPAALQIAGGGKALVKWAWLYSHVRPREPLYYKPPTQFLGIGM